MKWLPLLPPWAQATAAGLLVLLALGLLWWRGAPRWWMDISTDATGRYVPLRLFKAICYFAGLGQIGVASVLNLLAAPGDVQYQTAVGFELLLIGLFGQVVKEGADFLGRKTRDGDGALATPPERTPPAAPAPQLMPQEEGAEAPAGPRLYGYSNGQIE